MNIYWTQAEVVSGLVRAVIYTEEGDRIAPLLQIKVDEKVLYEAACERHHDGNLHVNFHTHLIANGEHHFSVAILDGDAPRSIFQDFEVANDGLLATDVSQALKDAHLPVIFIGDCDASHYAEASSGLKHWMDRPDARERVQTMLESGEISQEEQGLLLHFLEQGFVVLPEKLPDEMISAANDAIAEAVEQKYQGYEYGSSQRLEQMHVTFPAIRDIWLYSRVHRFLSLVFGADSQPCQSLVYTFGSQQDAHQDTVHLTPFPAGLMCGVWVALEDVREGSGELAIYPGSHRLPRIYMNSCDASKVRGDWGEFGEKVVPRWRKEISDAGIKRKIYDAKRGDILIWHENLMHEGTVRSNPELSRRSVVTHNFAKGAIVFYDSSGDVGHIHK